MPSTPSPRPIALAALAALLGACAAAPASTQSNSDSAGSAETSAATTTSEPTMSEPTTSEPTTTAQTTDATQSSTGASAADTSGTTSDASTSTATGSIDTGTGTGTETGTGSETGTGTGSDTSTGEGTDTGTTGADGVLGAAAIDAMEALEQAVAGVTYPSESDYPWVVVGFADAAPVSEANVKEVIAAVYVPHPGEAALADRAIELRTLAQLFDPLTVPKDWWDDDNKMVAAQYTEIRAVLEGKLVDIQVFRIGEQQGNVLQGAVDIYVLGATPDGDLVGMWTVSIET